MSVHRATLNVSKAPCANVEASVTWDPNELFLVVVTIKPASANRAIASMTRAIKVSMSVKPSNFKFDLIQHPLTIRLYY